jgi:hypothetical protein
LSIAGDEALKMGTEEQSRDFSEKGTKLYFTRSCEWRMLPARRMKPGTFLKRLPVFPMFNAAAYGGEPDTALLTTAPPKPAG